MKMKNVIAAIALCTFFFASCKKEATGSSASSFDYQLKAVNPAPIGGRMSETFRIDATNIQWIAGKASATELRFEATNASGETEFKQKTTQQIDLFAASSSLGSITIPAGTYNQVEFKAFFAPLGSSPALELSGSFTSGGITKPVVFTVNSSVELKAEKQNITVSSGFNYSALNTIDLSQLVQGVSATALANATVTNGTIVISSNSNSNIYNIILTNLINHHTEAEVEHHEREEQH